MRDERAAAATRRAFGTVAGVGAPAALLAACGAPSAGGGTDGQGAGATKRPVKIAYWVKWGGTSEEAENAVIAAFQGKFPHITVEGTEDANLAGSGRGDREKFIAALAAGSPPDLIKIDRFMMGGHGAKRTTTLLDDVIKRDKLDMKKFYPATVEEVLYPPNQGGKITALPWNTDDRALIYNKKHFVEAGLDPNSPPKTWEDAAEVGKKLTKMEGGRLVRPGFVAWGANTNWGLGWHWAAGGQFLKASADGKPNRKAAFNDDKMRRTLEYVRDNMISVMGGFPAYDEWRQRWGAREQGAWYNDGLSMGVHGSWMVGDFRRFGPHVDWGVAPAPRPKGMEGTPVTWAGGFALAIPTGIKAEQLDAAWEFVKYYCYGKEAQLLFGSRTGQMPALIEAAEDKAYRESDPRMPVFVEVMKHAKIRDVTPAGDEVWSTTADRQFAIGGLADRVYENKLSIADILNE
ncbi:MAG: ABC transporter substrate-binding protein, partial [Chloroflexota bacterium]|nr:ABC transporter substrate-binding protein [Chloroflexota bacterium]